MSKLKSKGTRISNPFDATVKKTERTAVAILMHWMRNIIEENNLDLGFPDVDTTGSDRKSPDVVIYETRRSKKVIMLIEAKQPCFNVFDEEELKEPARKKSNKRKSKYFATTNFKNLIWFNTEKANNPEKYGEEEQVVEKIHLSEIEDLDLIEQPAFREPIKKALKNFLIKLIAVYSGKEPEPKHPVDELLIFRLHEKIRVLTYHYRYIIEDKCHKEIKFRKALGKWFFDQGWNFSWQSQDFEKAARQTAYLLVNKILFYDVLQSQRPSELEPLLIHEDRRNSYILGKILQAYFDLVLRIDYQTIFDADFIDIIAFPDSKDVVKEIKDLIKVLNQYNFKNIPYDIIGNLFEKLIPLDERHILGQYFTKADVVDLILKFCLNHEEDKVLDPACGAGTFIVRAYHHKKIMNDRLEHENILPSLWGIDIAKFPAHLAQINLAIKDLSSNKNYPNIIKEDFFNFLVGAEGFEPKEWRKKIAKTLAAKEIEIEHPRWFDVIVGNPPYTRQEEIEEISEKDKFYKEQIIRNSLKGINGKKIVEISKRAGIHAYFFVHGTKFLRDGGYFGFIVSNSWLDVDYGKGLQELFLRYYKIIAIIESKVERWFADADVNTCIIILQKCDNEKEREKNLARFVYLKKPFKYFFPQTSNDWQEQLKRLNAIESLKKTILSHNDLYENEELRIYPKTQKELWEEGYDVENNKYSGSKWGKYLRAPEIYFKILKKGKDYFVNLKEVATVRRGFTTGANEFFYLSKDEIKRFRIEDEYLGQIIFSLKEIQKYKIEAENLDKKVIVCHKEKKNLRKTNLLNYIKFGETQSYHKRPTCSSRSLWYSLGKDWEYAPLIFPAKIGERMPVALNINIFEDKKLYGVIPDDLENTYLIGALLNSTLSRLFIEFSCRQLTGAQAIADIDVNVVENLDIIDLKKISKSVKNKLEQCFKNLIETKAESLFIEISDSVEEIDLNNIKTERRELDKIVMEEILKLSENEQIEIYRAIIDLVKSRLEKAKSVENNTKNKDGLNIKLFVGNIMEKIGEETLGSFYKNRILNQTKFNKIDLPKIKSGFKPFIDKELLGWRVYYSKNEFIICDSEEQARYIKVFFDKELEELTIPKDYEYLSSIIIELEELNDKIENIIEESLEFIYQKKLKNNLSHKILSEIMNYN